MKVIIYTAVATLLLLASPAFAVNAELNIADVSGATGSSVEIPINLKSSVGIGSIDVVVSYDANMLQLESVEKGSLSSNSMIDYNAKTSGSVAIAMVDSGGVKGEGSVAVLKFKVLGKEGDRSTITIKSASANEAATLIDVRLDTKAGSFSVAGGGGIGSLGIAVAVVVVLLAILMLIKRKGSKPK